ncbi:hypothetical protein ACFE04_014008 [Oxalis oulophora]
MSMVASLSTVVTVKNTLRYPPIDLQCRIEAEDTPHVTVQPGGVFTKKLDNLTDKVYGCTGYRKDRDQDVGFAGVDPTGTDAGQANVFWELRQDGAYHSFDNIHFVKKNPWIQHRQ